MDKLPVPFLETSNEQVPIGSVVMWCGGTPVPAGWLRCDGQLISRTTYADLYAITGDGWGAGDGTTTFQLPDTRGVFPKGAGTTDRASGKDGSGSFYSMSYGGYSQDRFQGHKHWIGHYSAGAGASLLVPAPVNVSSGALPTSAPADDPSGGTARFGNSTEPQSIGLYFIIKALRAGASENNVIRVAV